MDSAARECDLDDGVPPRGSPLYSVRGGESRVHQELSVQLDSTLAFADFCMFLTSNRVSQQAGQLVSLAQALYEEAVAEQRRSRPRR